jgi:hypothetical protein
MSMFKLQPYKPGLNETMEQKVKNLCNAYVEVMEQLTFLFGSLDSKNVKRLTTEYTKISSDRGETTFDGPLITMKDKQIVPIVRLQMGYDPVSQRFTFKMMDTKGNKTLSMSDLGQILLSGKPLFEMYDNQATPVLRRKIGYDPATTLFVDEWYSPLGVLTAYIDTNGKLVVVDGFFTGSITGSTITGGTIKTAAAGNDRIELTSNGLTSYNAANQKEGFAVETGTYGYCLAVIYAGGSRKGGLEYSATQKMVLFTDPGTEMIIAPATGSTNLIFETWNCNGARFDNLKDVSGNNYITGTTGFTGTKVIGGETYTWANGLLVSVV